jgi:hypothetical protein
MMMQAGRVYEERIFSLLTTVIMTVICSAMLFMFFYQLLVCPVGTRPAPNWFFLVMFLVFLALGLNFARMTVRIDQHGISVGYKIIRHNISWGNVTECYREESSSLRYGGWGIRFGRVEGKWRLVFNIIGGERVVIGQNQGRWDEFVFTTNNP